MYQYSDNEKDAPVKLHDHACNACRYAIMGMGSGITESVPISMMSSGGVDLPGFGYDGDEMPGFGTFGYGRNIPTL